MTYGCEVGGLLKTNNHSSHIGCAMTYIGSVHICPLLQQQLHHIGMTTLSSPVERGLAFTLMGAGEKKEAEIPT